MSQLTTSRRSLLAAFRAWPATARAFARWFDFETNSDGMKDAVPALSDLPALRVFPVQVTPSWWVAGQQKWPYSLQVEVWVKDWHLPPAERLIEELVNAAFGAKNAGESCSIIEKANSRLAGVSNLTFEFTRVGDPPKVKAIRASVLITLTPTYSPQL